MVEAKAWDVAVVHKVLALAAQVIFWTPIATDSKNLAAALVNRYDVRQSNTGCVTILVFVFVAGNIQLNTHLKNFVAVICGCAETKLLGNLLLDFV